MVDETFTPPLSDCTPLIQKVRSSRPEILLLLPTAIPDDKLCLEKLNEFGLGRGRVPVISNGAHIAAPDMLKNLGKDLLEGVMTVVGNWSGKGQEQIMKEFVAKTGEPWITQDSLSTYGDMWIFKEALEKAGVRRPQEGRRRHPRHGYERGAGEVSSRAAASSSTTWAGASMPISLSCNGKTACRSRSIRSDRHGAADLAEAVDRRSAAEIASVSRDAESGGREGHRYPAT